MSTRPTEFPPGYHPEHTDQNQSRKVHSHTGHTENRTRELLIQHSHSKPLSYRDRKIKKKTYYADPT